MLAQEYSYSYSFTREDVAQCYDYAINLLQTKGWVQGHYAVDAEGAPALDTSPEACRYCMIGAICCAWFNLKKERLARGFVYQPLHEAISRLHGDWDTSLHIVNDKYVSSKEEVIEFYKLAKELTLSEKYNFEYGGEKILFKLDT